MNHHPKVLRHNINHKDILYHQQHTKMERHVFREQITARYGVFGKEMYSFKWNNPEKQKARLFLYEMELLEDESNIAIIVADKQAETALTEFENNPTPQTYADMRKAMTDYYKEQKKSS